MKLDNTGWKTYTELPTKEDELYFSLVIRLARKGYSEEEAKKIAQAILELDLLDSIKIPESEKKPA